LLKQKKQKLLPRKQQLQNIRQTKKLKKLNLESNLQHGKKLKLKDYLFLHFLDL
jgi:hypothetical protein